MRDTGSIKEVGIHALARDLNVSLTPVREALARLDADRLVTKSGYGTAPLVARRDFEELYEVRLEPLAVRRAATRRTEESLRLPEFGEPDALPPGRRRIEAISGGLPGRLPQMTRRFTKQSRQLQAMRGSARCSRDSDRTCSFNRLMLRIDIRAETIAEHERILAAIQAGDGEEAEQRATIFHVESSREGVRPFVAGPKERT